MKGSGRRAVTQRRPNSSKKYVQKHKNAFYFDPPATTNEVEASSLQFVRKLSGMNKPSKANKEAFYLAVERVAAAAQEMLNTLVTAAQARDREIRRSDLV